MDLRNTLPHKANTKILVDGTVYDIDKEGIVHGISKEAAEKLLQNPVWTKSLASGKPEARTPKKAEKPHKTVLLSENDELVEGQKALDEEDKEEVEEGAEAEEEGVDEDDDEETSEDDEWPDPTEDMDIEYLRQMADAYEVSYTARVGAATLVKRIKAAMYGDE